MSRIARRPPRSGRVLPLIVITIMGAFLALAVIQVLTSWEGGLEPESTVISKAAPATAPAPAPPPTAPIRSVAKPSNAPAGDRVGIEALLVRYAAAVTDTDSDAFVACYDLERLLTVVEGLDILSDLTRSDRLAVLGSFREALGQTLAELAKKGTGRGEIRRIDAIPETEDVLVRFRVPRQGRPADNVSWWLTRKSGEWKIFNTEDRDLGVRAAELMGAAAAAHLRTTGWVRSVPSFTRARAHLLAGNHEQAIELLDAMSHPDMPKALQGLRRTWLAFARAATGDLDGAAREAATAGPLRGDIAALDLIRAAVANRAGDSRTAMNLLARYQEVAGPTAASCIQLARAERELGRMGESIRTLRAGLADDRSSLELMMQLALTLPDERMAELAADFASMPDPGRAFQSLAMDLLEAGASEAVIVLAQKQRELEPAHETAPLLEAQAHVAAGRPAAAAALLSDGLAMVSSAQRPAYQARLAEALLQDGRPVEAYNALPDPAAAFAMVADQLAERRDGAGLSALVAAHQARFPADPSLPYYNGLVAELAGRLDEAARAFLRAYRETTDDAARRRLHRAAVSCMYRAGTIMKAYDTIEPRQDTANVLAQLCAQDRDDRQLERLYESHVRRVPDDRAWRRWSAELAFIRGDYLAAKLAIDAVRVVCLDREDLVRWYDDRLVRTLIRLGRHDDALRAAREATRRRDGDMLYEFIVYAASGRPAEAIRLARRLVSVGNYELESLYQDPDCMQQLTSEPVFAQFREAFPRRPDARPAPSLSAEVWTD